MCCRLINPIQFYIYILVALVVVVFVVKKLLSKNDEPTTDAKTCPQGHKNVYDARYCQTCGANIEKE